MFINLMDREHLMFMIKNILIKINLLSTQILCLFILKTQINILLLSMHVATRKDLLVAWLTCE